VFVGALNSPTVKLEEDRPTKPDLVLAEGQEVLIIESDWRTPIIDFIIHNKSHPKKKEHKKCWYFLTSSLELLVLGNSTGNACWYFLTSSPGLLVLCNDAGNTVVVCLSDYRMNPQVHRYTVVAYHLESIRVLLFIFSLGWHGAKESTGQHE
jgi:hypothetical protein